MVANGTMLRPRAVREHRDGARPLPAARTHAVAAAGPTRSTVPPVEPMGLSYRALGLIERQRHEPLDAGRGQVDHLSQLYLDGLAASELLVEPKALGRLLPCKAENIAPGDRLGRDQVQLLVDPTPVLRTP